MATVTPESGALEVAIRLGWDAEFRRRFLTDREACLAVEYPGSSLAGIFARAHRAGIEENAYRHLASLHRSSKEVFPAGHPVMCAYFGATLFEQVLCNIFRDWITRLGADDRSEILDPFDGYVVGPFIRDALGTLVDSETSWIVGVLTYEWAIWHASRVLSGWPPLEQFPPLVPGGYLVEVDYDLQALIAEIRRVVKADACEALVRRRIRPGGPRFRRVIFPKGDSILQVRLGDDEYAEIESAITNAEACVRPSLSRVALAAGLFVENAFLCCPDELRDKRDGAEVFSSVVEYGPH